ncbi:MAG: SDR family oxidoreductase [Gemmatimonadota bacterium]|jgi:NADP-dependent 3-hydroxy acid dehydrogenase YdfG
MGSEGTLKGRVAVVTGASSGIGAAVAGALAAEGAAVVLGARRNERLEAVAAEIEAAGGRAAYRATDVTVRSDVSALVDLARERFGGVHVLVNNAGIMPLSPVAALRVDDWERMVDVNVKGVLYAIGAVLPLMLEQEEGHIVNVGSLAGRRPFPGGTVYSATKFAVRSLTWGMQLELSAARGIRVTDIQPGVVATELMDHIPDPGIQEGFDRGWADKRRLQPDDVARAVLFAVTSPAHVNVNEILIRPTDQTT